MKFDVIIPTIFRDYHFLKKVVRYVFMNLHPEVVFIITNKEKSKYLPKDILKNPRCEVIDEDGLLPDLTYDNVREMLINHQTVNPHFGWYYQQFLKMGFARSEYSKNEYYLSWDSDTLPIQPISMTDTEGHPLFTMKNEFHQPYFNSISRLIGIGKENPNSYIAEHMLFNKTIMEELISEIEASTVSGKTWYEKIINSTDRDAANGFSEFELYGNFCKIRHASLYRERELPGFRYGGYIQGRFINDKTLSRLSYDLAIVSFEAYHTPPFPWGTICDLQYKYFKKKERLIEKKRNWSLRWKL